MFTGKRQIWSSGKYRADLSVQEPAMDLVCWEGKGPLTVHVLDHSKQQKGFFGGSNVIVNIRDFTYMVLFCWLLIKINPKQVTFLGFPICKMGTVRPNAAVITHYNKCFYSASLLQTRFPSH